MFGWLWDWLKGWLFIAVAAYVAALVFGVPHVLFEYTERVRGHKIACTYYGPFGKVRGLAGRDLPGNCPYIALLPLKEDWAAWPERQLEDLTDRASDQWEELKNRLGQWTGELWGWAVMIGGAALAVALGRFYWRRRSRPRVGGRAGSWRQKPHGGPDRRAEEPRGQEQAEALRREREALERERRERERLERQAREEQERRREDAQRQERVREQSADDKYREALRMFGLQEGYSLGELRAKYRALSKQLHPDAGGTDGLFAWLQEAFVILSKRAR